jgi:hypothetical protein
MGSFGGNSATHSSPMNPLRIVLLAALAASLLPACDGSRTAPEDFAAGLRTQNARLTARVDSLTQRLAILEQEQAGRTPAAAGPTLLRDWDLTYLREHGLKDPVPEIKASLARHTHLIPQEGVLGGANQVFEDKIFVLNRRWVLAYFEDGHNVGNILLSYQVNKGKITWKVIRSELF